MRSARTLIIVPLLCCLLIPAFAQTNTRTNGGARPKPAVAEPNGGRSPVSEMRSSIERYSVDRGSLARSYPVAVSRTRRERFKKFYGDWWRSLQSLNFDSMSQDGKIDYMLFKNHLEYELRQLDIQSKQIGEIEPLLPFAAKIIELEETRRRMEPIDSAKIAATLTELQKTGRRATPRRRSWVCEPRHAAVSASSRQRDEKERRESSGCRDQWPAHESAKLVHVLQRLRSDVYVVERRTLPITRSGHDQLRHLSD